MNRQSLLVERTVAIIAIAFGLLTIAVGSSVFLGYFDPGYIVFVPLLIFNIFMGFVYTAAGFLIWQHHKHALQTTKAIVLLNLAVLLAILAFYFTGMPVADESLKAMAFRTVVWLIIFASLKWIQK